MSLSLLFLLLSITMVIATPETMELIFGEERYLFSCDEDTNSCICRENDGCGPGINYNNPIQDVCNKSEYKSQILWCVPEFRDVEEFTCQMGTTVTHCACLRPANGNTCTLPSGGSVQNGEEAPPCVVNPNFAQCRPSRGSTEVRTISAESGTGALPSPAPPVSQPTTEPLPCTTQRCQELDSVWIKIRGIISLLPESDPAIKIFEPRQKKWTDFNHIYYPATVTPDAGTIPGTPGDCSYLQSPPLPSTLSGLKDKRYEFCTNTHGKGRSRYTQNAQLRSINSIVYHYTGGTTVQSAIDTWEADRIASAHYIVDKNGEIYSVVDERDIAWHVEGSNANSIGIEIVNLGNDCGEFPTKCTDFIQKQRQKWEKYPTKQMDAVIKLTKYLVDEYDIPVDRAHLRSHEELQSGKVDPGPAFDWDSLLSDLGGTKTAAPTTATSPATMTVENIADPKIRTDISSGQYDLQFLQLLERDAAELKLNPVHILAIISFESRFEPTATNQKSGYAGLLQFSPDSAREVFGNNALSDSEALRRIKATGRNEQLKYVKTYFKNRKSKMQDNSFIDTAMAVIRPAAIGKRESEVLFRRGELAYSNNIGLDNNADGLIIMDEYLQPVRSQGYDLSASSFFKPGAS